MLLWRTRCVSAHSAVIPCAVNGVAPHVINIGSCVRATRDLTLLRVFQFQSNVRDFVGVTRSRSGRPSILPSVKPSMRTSRLGMYCNAMKPRLRSTLPSRSKSRSSSGWK